MKGQRALIAVTMLIVAALVTGCDEDSDDEIRVSGTIEAETAVITAAYGGRVLEVLVEEGDTVEKDEELVRLDAELLDAQLEQAQAVVEAARARLAEETADPRPAELDQAKAEVDQAVAQWNGAKEAWEYAREMAADPPQVEEQLIEASTTVSQAEVQVEFAESALATAESRVEDAATGDEREIGQAQVEAAQAQLEQARAALRGARNALQSLTGIRDNPLESLAAVNRAEVAYRQAEAQVEVAQARLDLLEAGATDEEIEAAEADVEQAEAAAEALELQRAEMTLVAPRSGTIIGRSVEPGEIATPGTSLMRVASLDEVGLVVFVPEGELDSVELGQEIDIEVDAYPDDVFEGRVTFVAQEAEFTPRNVQTEDQRANLVFAVTITIDNEDRRLRPGMPADAFLELD